MSVEGTGMDAHIDWVSFTLPVGEGANIVSMGDFMNESDRLLIGLGGPHYEYVHDGSSFEPLVGRAPYRYQLQRDDRGVRIFGGGPNRTILYEFTGRACEGIRDKASYQAFIAPIVDRVTRLDLAADIRCETRPSEFSNDRIGERFRSVGYVRSETGETCYIGSPKSDRFARVYRYNHPHPRHKDLRIEFVFRKDAAKSTAEALLNEAGISSVVSAAGVTFGFKHPVWDPEFLNTGPLRAPVTNRAANDTVAWLYRSVAPAVRRLLIEGALDWNDFATYIWEGDEPRP